MAGKSGSAGDLTQVSRVDIVKLVLAVIILAAGIAGYYFFSSQLVVFRVLGLIVLGAVALGLFLMTAVGKKVIGFLRNSRVEVRKIVWPSRQETIQVTLVVIAMTVLVGVGLWLIDLSLGWIIKVVMGYGG